MESVISDPVVSMLVKQQILKFKNINRSVLANREKFFKTMERFFYFETVQKHLVTQVQERNT